MTKTRARGADRGHSTPDQRVWNEKERLKKNGFDPKHFQETETWRDSVTKVLKATEAGFDAEQIIQVTGIDPLVVRRVIEEEQAHGQVAIQNFKNKIPLMKEIVGLGLDAIKASLIDMQDPEVRQNMLKRPADLSALTNVITGLNTLLRLEQNQSTENVAINTRSLQDTRMLLHQLKTMDPIFGDSYPEAPKPIEVLSPNEENPQ